MELATIWIETDPVLRSNVRKENVTPAQCLIIRRQFGKKVPGDTKPSNPITHLKLTGNVQRTDEEEYRRLIGTYGSGTENQPGIVEKAFPGENPKMPTSFKDVGYSETSPVEPLAGEKHKIEKLQEIPRGLDDDELEDAKGSSNESEKFQAVVLAQQKQIQQLTDLVSKIAGASAQASQPKATDLPPVPPAPKP